MLKKLMITTAMGGLMMGSAFAQSTDKAMDAPAAQPTPPAAIAPATPATPKADTTVIAPKADTTVIAPNTDSNATRSTTGSGSSSVQVVSTQKPDQWLASKFKGTDVIGADGQKIGDVSDILFDKSGKIDAFIVSVGGFLGMGAKDVALAPAAFEVIPGDKSKNESDKLKVSMTKDQLKQAANFEPYNPPRATTGMGGAPRPAPATPAAPAPRNQ
jgi:sporulation protein YlmC with PRC-barrel domain